jgi:hypothetical protein
MQDTTTQTPQVTRTDLLSRKMHPNSIAQILPILITPWHLSFHESFTKLPGQVAGAAERLQQPTKFYSKIRSEYLSSALNSSLQLSTALPTSHSYIANEFIWTSQLAAQHRPMSFCRPPSFHLPSSMQLHPSPSLAPPLSCTP